MLLNILDHLKTFLHLNCLEKQNEIFRKVYFITIMTKIINKTIEKKTIIKKTQFKEIFHDESNKFNQILGTKLGKL